MLLDILCIVMQLYGHAQRKLEKCPKWEIDSVKVMWGMWTWADLTKVTKLGAALSFYPNHAHAMLSKNTFTSAPFRHPTLAAYYAVMLLTSVSPTLLLLVYDSLSASSTTTTSLCLYLQRPPFYPLLPRTSSSSSYYHQSPLLFYFSSFMLTLLLRHHRLCLQSELQPTPVLLHTSPRLCRDPP